MGACPLLGGQEGYGGGGGGEDEPVQSRNHSCGDKRGNVKGRRKAGQGGKKAGRQQAEGRGQKTAPPKAHGPGTHGRGGKWGLRPVGGLAN